MRVSDQSLFLFTMFVIRDFLHAIRSTVILSPVISMLILLLSLSALFTNWWRCYGTYKGKSCRMVPRGFIGCCLQMLETSNNCAFGTLQLAPVAIVFVCLCHSSFLALSPPRPGAQDSILFVVIHQTLYLQCFLIVQITPKYHFPVQLCPASLSKIKFPQKLFSSFQNDVHLLYSS
jgi:hypothetical protein